MILHVIILTILFKEYCTDAKTTAILPDEIHFYNRNAVLTSNYKEIPTIKQYKVK